MKFTLVLIGFLALVGLTLARHERREEPCCKNPVFNKEFADKYFETKYDCGYGVQKKKGNCWGKCVLENGNMKTQEDFFKYIVQEPKEDVEWKKQVAASIVTECLSKVNDTDQNDSECPGNHLEMLRCAVRRVENSCPAGMWDEKDPRCSKH